MLVQVITQNDKNQSFVPQLKKGDEPITCRAGMISETPTTPSLFFKIRIF